VSGEGALYGKKKGEKLYMENSYVNFLTLFFRVLAHLAEGALLFH